MKRFILQMSLLVLSLTIGLAKENPYKAEGKRFAVTVKNEQKLYFKVLSEARAEVVLSRGPYGKKAYVIPKEITYNGKTYTVVAIEDRAFYEKDGLKSIELPFSIEYIGEEAFEDCSFDSFVFPSSLREASIHAFNNTIIDNDKFSLMVLSYIGKLIVHPLAKGAYVLHKINKDSIFFQNSETGTIKSFTDYEFESNLLSALFEGCESSYDSVYYVKYYFPVLKKVMRTNNPENRYSGVSEVEDESVKRYKFEDDIISVTISGLPSNFSFVLRNKTENSLKIIWDEAVFVDFNGNTSKVMHNGVKYAERENAQMPTTIITGAQVSDNITPNVFVKSTNSGWIAYDNYPKDASLEGSTIKIMLPIQIKNQINEYIFEFSLKYIESKETATVKVKPRVVEKPSSR
ncbi:MAG: leucine-rich repeat domain-containing protein [Bacteroidales bacterium]|nr:leucine-rich repeat domain-containing protein [Bacteroidales bacterium]